MGFGLSEDKEHVLYRCCVFALLFALYRCGRRTCVDICLCFLLYYPSIAQRLPVKIHPTESSYPET
jgi:hypothetical protein